jgi:hypothetical protein
MAGINKSHLRGGTEVMYLLRKWLNAARKAEFRGMRS